MEIRIQPSTEKDLDRGFDFYERQRTCLGDYFLEILLSDINKLQFTAGIHSKRGNLFRVKSKKFPHWIYYRIAESIIYVVAILDARQAPSKIDQREKKEQEFFS